ncbi:Transcription factor grauzone, partial [Pseudolycoriella hygida]
MCWINTKTFHLFYKAVELLQEGYWNSIKTAEINLCVETVKEEPIETEINFDLNLVKSEETKVEAEVVATEVIEEGSKDIASCEQRRFSLNVDKVKFPSRKGTESVFEGKKTKKPKQEIKENKYGHKINDVDFDYQVREYFHMKCDICGDPFETYRSAQKHYRAAHKIEGYLICCGQKFHRRGRVLNHIKYHLNPDEFSCDQCSRKFANKKALALHIENHVPLNSRAFKCDLCPKSFPRETTLIRHKDFVHSPVKCVECDISYPSKSKLSTHIKNTHQPKVTTTRVCDICGKDFANKYILQAHMQAMHSTNENSKFQCDICGSWIKHKGKLKEHMERHWEGTATCSICSKVLINKFSLKIHMRYVHNEKWYPCTICDKTLRTRLSLKEHMAGHTGQDLYECAYCTKTFKSSANMYSHRKKMHLAAWTQD